MEYALMYQSEACNCPDVQVASAKARWLVLALALASRTSGRFQPKIPKQH
jgi:hypothetical protein